MKLNKSALTDVILWLLVIVVSVGMYFISDEGVRCVLYIILLVWGADRFVDWISEGR